MRPHRHLSRPPKKIPTNRRSLREKKTKAPHDVCKCCDDNRVHHGVTPVTPLDSTHPGHRDVDLYFGKDSGVLRASQYQVKAEEQGGKQVSQQVGYGNYKEMEGIKNRLDALDKARKGLRAHSPRRRA